VQLLKFICVVTAIMYHLRLHKISPVCPRIV